jgi:hypothetical protein
MKLGPEIKVVALSVTGETAEDVLVGVDGEVTSTLVALFRMNWARATQLAVGWT